VTPGSAARPRIAPGHAALRQNRANALNIQSLFHRRRLANCRIILRQAWYPIVCAAFSRQVQNSEYDSRSVDPDRGQE
jgi:hypothetical protein